LIQQIAVGGMAEIYLAKTRGIGGFEKFLALKVIHPNYAQDEHFVKMLVDEAKIAVHLQHVNIAQIFDLGRIDQTYYIAMEFVDGADLFRILKRASEIELDMAIELAAFVAQEVCAALDYAHNKKDDFGRPLAIIHRDISPQNVLISYAGEVKLVDFGIAKATQRLQNTAAGVIKGKYYYMSPEQAWGDPVDHRTDVFSAGILLYEMLVGQMLYLEEDLTVLLDRVRKADIQSPRTLRPDLPVELEAIVMKALARKPEERFLSAHAFGRALERFLFAYAPDMSANRLGAFVDRVMGDDRDRLRVRLGPRGATREVMEVISREDYQPDREHSVLFKPSDLEIAARPSSPRPANQATLQGPPDFSEADSTLISGPPQFMPVATPRSGEESIEGPTDVLDLSGTPHPPNVVIKRPPILQPGARPRLPGIGAPSSGGAARRKPPPPPPPPPHKSAPMPKVEPVALYEDYEAVKQPSPRSEVAAGASAAPARREPDLTEQPTLRSPESPVARLPFGSAQVLPLVKRPPTRRVRTIVWGLLAAIPIATATITWLMSAPAAAPPRGRLKIVSVPPNALVRLDGRPIGEHTPVTVPDLDRERVHQVEVSLRGYRSKLENVQREEEIIVVLQPDVGTLTVQSEPPGAEVYVNGHPSGLTPALVRDVPFSSAVTLELRLRGYHAYRELVEWNGQHDLARKIILRRSQ